MFAIRGGHLLPTFPSVHFDSLWLFVLPWLNQATLATFWQELPRIIDAELISTQPEPEGHGFVWKGKEIRLDSMATRWKKHQRSWGKGDK